MCEINFAHSSPFHIHCKLFTPIDKKFADAFFGVSNKYIRGGLKKDTGLFANNCQMSDPPNPFFKKNWAENKTILGSFEGDFKVIYRVFL